jgi:hypothetical protein
MSSKDTSKHKILAAQYAQSLSKRQSMVDSWLSGSDAATATRVGVSTTTIATRQDQNKEIEETPHFEFKALPSSVVGLGSTRSKLSHKQIRDAELRVASAAAARAEAALGNNAALRKLAKGLPVKSKHSSGGPRGNNNNPRGNGKNESESEDEEEESKSSSARRMIKPAQKSFFDAYRVSKKKKK